jgi:hypothetical protein
LLQPHLLRNSADSVHKQGLVVDGKQRKVATRLVVPATQIRQGTQQQQQQQQQQGKRCSAPTFQFARMLQSAACTQMAVPLSQ